MSNVQRCFVDWRLSIDELKNDNLESDNENLLDEIVDDECDDEVIIHVFSQLKKKHVVDAFFCYDVLILDEKHSRFVRHRTKIVQLIKIDQIQWTFRNVKRVRKKNFNSLNVDLACHSYRVLFDDYRWFVKIIHTNEFRKECVRDKNKSISYIVLKANRV